MLYIWTMTVTSGTTEETPKEEKQPIRTGVIKKLEIFMPKGCKGYVYATISHRLMQLLPFNPNGAVRANGVTVTGEYDIDIKDAQPELILRAWSPDAVKNHTITYRANIVPKEEITLKDLLNELKKTSPKGEVEPYPI